MTKFDHRIPLRAVILGSMFFAACGAGSTEYAARGEPIAPDVELEVEMNRVRSADGQWPLTVQVQELPRPSDMGASVRAYVAWAQEPGADAPRFLGVLRYDQDARFGEVDASTEHDQLTIFVTAEATEQPTAPSDQVIVRRDIAHDPR